MIIADTGFWIALINRKDKHHLQAREQLRLLTADRETLITTCAVMTETCHLLSNGWESRHKINSCVVINVAPFKYLNSPKPIAIDSLS